MLRKIFDSAYRTMARKMPQLFIPLINESFGRSYAEDEPISQQHDRFRSGRGWVETDSIFQLCGVTYHIECQSTNPDNMALRMLEYDFHIAATLTKDAQPGKPRGGVWEVQMPNSCVVYLRNAPSSLDARIIGPDGQHLTLQPRVIRAADYGMQEMFEKRLLVLYPFYLMRYERKLPTIAANPARRELLLQECAQLYNGLARAAGSEADDTVYNELVHLADEVARHLFRKQSDLGEEARTIMGGDILESWSEKLDRLSREAEERGLERGLERGEAIGLERGLERGEAIGLERGEAIGLERGKQEMLQSLVDKGLISPEIAATEGWSPL